MMVYTETGNNNFIRKTGKRQTSNIKLETNIIVKCRLQNINKSVGVESKRDFAIDNPQ